MTYRRSGVVFSQLLLLSLLLLGACSSLIVLAFPFLVRQPVRYASLVLCFHVLAFTRYPTCRCATHLNHLACESVASRHRKLAAGSFPSREDFSGHRLHRHLRCQLRTCLSRSWHRAWKRRLTCWVMRFQVCAEGLKSINGILEICAFS